MNILDEIVSKKKTRVNEAKSKVPIEDIQNQSSVCFFLLKNQGRCVCCELLSSLSIGIPLVAMAVTQGFPVFPTFDGQWSFR